MMQTVIVTTDPVGGRGMRDRLSQGSNRCSCLSCVAAGGAWPCSTVMLALRSSCRRGSAQLVEMARRLEAQMLQTLRVSTSLLAAGVPASRHVRGVAACLLFVH